MFFMRPVESRPAPDKQKDALRSSGSNDSLFIQSVTLNQNIPDSSPKSTGYISLKNTVFRRRCSSLSLDDPLAPPRGYIRDLLNLCSYKEISYILMTNQDRGIPTEPALPRHEVSRTKRCDRLHVLSYLALASFGFPILAA